MGNMFHLVLDRIDSVSRQAIEACLFITVIILAGVQI